MSCTVFANDFRHPAALAKDIATTDILSGGRLEFGIGAGWNKPSYDRVGVHFDAPTVRVERLEEAVRVIKGLWGNGPFTFTGTYYTISNYDGFPKSLPRPHPPIFMRGGGKRLLSFAAREAEIAGIGARAKPTGDGLDHAEETDAWVTRKLEAAPDRFDQLEFALLVTAVAVSDDRQAAG